MATEIKAPEQRTATVDVAEMQTEGKKLTGYAALYGVESRDLGGFTEVISPGAFRDVLARNPDVYLTFNHSPDKVLARTTSGTLRLRDEERGLAFEADLGEGPTAQDVREMVRRGDVNGASFRFVVADENWEGERRTVTSIAELIDLSLATTPAYEGPTVELRSRQTNDATGTGADRLSDEAKHEERSDEQRSEKKTEERSEVKVVHEPEPVLQVEDRAGSSAFTSLADAFRQRGFPGETATVEWGEYRSLTWTGGTVDLLNPLRRDGVPLGADQRYAWPAFQSVAVGSDVTSIQVLRQGSRTLAAGSVVVRAIDATSTKPEVSTAGTLTTYSMSQVAAVETNIPNLYLNQPGFDSLVEQDLRLTINEGLDYLVNSGVSTSGTISAGTLDILTNVRKAITAVTAGGYSPNTLLIDPAGAESIDLFRSSGSEKFFTFGAGRFAPGELFGLQVRVSKTAGTAVVDSAAYGKLYVSPISLARFEVDAGSTNRSNVRLEGHAAFGVERTAAAARIMP